MGNLTRQQRRHKERQESKKQKRRECTLEKGESRRRFLKIGGVTVVSVAALLTAAKVGGILDHFDSKDAEDGTQDEPDRSNKLEIPQDTETFKPPEISYKPYIVPEPELPKNVNEAELRRIAISLKRRIQEQLSKINEGSSRLGDDDNVWIKRFGKIFTIAFITLAKEIKGSAYIIKRLKNFNELAEYINNFLERIGYHLFIRSTTKPYYVDLIKIEPNGNKDVYCDEEKIGRLLILGDGVLNLEKSSRLEFANPEIAYTQPIRAGKFINDRYDNLPEKDKKYTKQQLMELITRDTEYHESVHLFLNHKFRRLIDHLNARSDLHEYTKNFSAIHEMCALGAELTKTEMISSAFDLLAIRHGRESYLPTMHIFIELLKEQMRKDIATKKFKPEDRLDDQRTQVAYLKQLDDIEVIRIIGLKIFNHGMRLAHRMNKKFGFE